MKISSGISSLDNLIDSFYIGDNVVWEIEAGTLIELFVLSFIERSISDKRNVIYVSFNKSPNTIIKKISNILKNKEKFILLDCFSYGKGKEDKTFVKFYETNKEYNVIKVDNPKDIENFINNLNLLEERFQDNNVYIFDSITGMQDLWGDENRTYKFFTYLCPRLYDLGTVAYWILEKDAHSQKFRANLRHITQVVLELYKRKDKFWIKAIKLEERTNKEAFKPHYYEIINETIVIQTVKKELTINIGEKIKELRIKAGMSQKELAEKINLTTSFISQIENNQIIPSLSSFIQICDVLGVNVFNNFIKNYPEKEWLIKKEDVYKNLIENKKGVKNFSIIKNGNLSFNLIELEPLSEHKIEMFKKGKKILYVLKGNPYITIQEKKENLKEGDCVYIKNDEFAYLRNEGGDNVEILLMNT